MRDNIRELLVASVAGVGYDPRNPEAIDNHERLYCKTKPHFGYPGRPDITVEEVKDRRQSCAINDAGRTIFKAVFEYEEDKSTVKACTVYHQGSEKTFIPELVRQEIIGTTVDDFIAEHTFEAVVREDQVYKGLVQLMERGELTDDLRGSYEIETLFKLKGAYEMARSTDAGQGEAMDVEGKFSGNEIALFREALEYAGYSGRCSDLVMAIVRDDDTKDILGASFDNMRKIYGSQAYQQWERTAEAKQWRKEYRPFEPKMSLRARMRSTFAMKAVEE
ncbi:TPA: hypothetical protein HA265_00285 [Candidatus Woesearchaeota archaeon]|nr:hypothetical protein [Candidatus Woesearchaeota archaeon]